MKKRILITGSSGFLGKNLSNKLQKTSFEVYGLDVIYDKILNNYFKVNLCNEKELDKIFKKQKFDCVIHLAAYVPETFSDVLDDKVLRENFESTLNLLLAFKKYKIPKFIFASGISVMGNYDMKITEDNNPDPKNLYFASKLIGEILTRQFKNPKNNISILRISAPFGPGQNENSVIPLFIKYALNSEDITILGKGKRGQDFIYIDDVITALIKVIETNNNGIINIASGKTTSTLQLAKTILKNIPGSKSKIVFTKIDPQEDLRVRVNINKAHKVLKFRPQISLEEGIKKYIKYFKDQK